MPTAASTTDLSIFWILPFCLMLLAIAVAPIKFHHWWEKNLNKLAVSVTLGLPVIIYFGVFFANGDHILLHTLHEYISFIILLSCLFIVSSGICIDGNFPTGPLTNTAFLLVGSILASIMGTTGAAMLLIRPLIQVNQHRSKVNHTILFFIIMVGNIGGSLTPIGDPPLFMGYLYGVPFSWTFQLWPQWLLCLLALSAIYLVIDSSFLAKEQNAPVVGTKARFSLNVLGFKNCLLLALSVTTVACVTEAIYRDLLLTLIAIVSFRLTDKHIHDKNSFSWTPIIEVAVLFLGIFATMIPALHFLKIHGTELGMSEPWQFFWGTGLLSSILDNTPTYVVFFRLAQSLHLGSEIVGMPGIILMAISLGSVFFGALTYIGNAPNFMIKTIAEERHIKMPSFFAYTFYSSLILFPLFLLVTILWF